MYREEIFLVLWKTDEHGFKRFQDALNGESAGTLLWIVSPHRMAEPSRYLWMVKVAQHVFSSHSAWDLRKQRVRGMSRLVCLDGAYRPSEKGKRAHIVRL